MRRPDLWIGAAALAGLLALAVGAAAAGRSSGAMRKGVPTAALAAAARATPVKAIDYDQVHCDAGLTLEAWLKALVGAHARAIVWTAGRCVLANDVNPLDAGSDWCAQATVTLAHPKSRDDAPMIEIYFDKPSIPGRPGPAYAFRGEMVTADGPDYTRFRKDFEAEWIERFGAPEGACTDPDG